MNLQLIELTRMSPHILRGKIGEGAKSNDLYVFLATTFFGDVPFSWDLSVIVDKTVLGGITFLKI